MQPAAAIGATAAGGRGLDGTDTAADIGDAVAAAADVVAKVRTAYPPLLSFDLPVVGNLGACGVLLSAEELRDLLLKAQSVATALAAGLPHVTNLDKLARRIRSDLEFVQRCCAHRYDGGEDAICQSPTKPTSAVKVVTDATATGGGGSGSGAGGGSCGSSCGGGGGGGNMNINIVGGRLLELTSERVQGIVNNLRGFQGELLAAQTAPGVVGVLRRFQAHVVLPSQSTVVAAPPPDPAAATGRRAKVTVAASGATAATATETGDVDRVNAVAATVGQKRPHADTDKKGNQDGTLRPAAGGPVAAAADTTPCSPAATVKDSAAGVVDRGCSGGDVAKGCG
ncbi:hypothetical protein Vafri_8950, partial [Volvox africanus]